MKSAQISATGTNKDVAEFQKDGIVLSLCERGFVNSIFMYTSVCAYTQ